MLEHSSFNVTCHMHTPKKENIFQKKKMFEKNQSFPIFLKKNLRKIVIGGINVG
jgi:hypothetical protein